RISKTLTSLNDILGDDRKIIIARELTKIYEEVIDGTAQELLTYISEHKKKEKGEFVVIIEPKR
ncbi:16S rRNA (cytidine(1402)-2'-O)-methyltransferase, partial [Patescibacteria group bacterium]|nr:16S rRNA (cytidine(1402)-2'-O)-methyltransferase [Patescibacteria group bacterium]